MGVSREDRVRILQSFNVGTLRVETAGEDFYAMRFFGGNAKPMGQYLFESFTPLTNRSGLALTPEFNAMSGLKQWQVSPGAVMLRGTAAPQLTQRSAL